MTRQKIRSDQIGEVGSAARVVRPRRPGLREASWTLLALALLVRVVVVLQLHGHPLLQPLGRLDSGVAVELARQLASGDLALRAGTDGQSFFFAPLYVYFLGLVFALTGGSALAVQLVQAVLGSAAVALLRLAARPWFGERAALAGGLLLALTGPVVFHEAILLQSSLDPFLTALALLAITRACVGRRVAAWAVAGAAIGVLALNRPNALAWGVALALCLPLFGRGEPLAHRVARTAALLVGLAFAIAPATLRNQAIAGEPVLISTHGGLNFYIGNRAEADGTYRSVPGITPDLRGQARDVRRVAEQQEGRALSGRETDAHFRALAWQWIRSHPLDAARLFARKVAYLCGATELALNYSYAYYAGDEPTLLRWLPVGAWLLVPFGLAGLADRAWFAGQPAANDDRRGYLLWALVAPAYGLSVAAFFVSSRYRLPLLVPLAAGAGFALTRLPGLARRRHARGLAAYAAALVPLGALAFWPHGLDDGRAEERTAMLLWLVDNGRSDDALRRLSAVEAAHPQPTLLLYRVGVALEENRRPGEAVVLLQRAASAEDRPEIQLALGQSLLDAGRGAEAVAHLRAAWQAGVRPEVSGFDLVRALGANGNRDEAAAVLERLAPSQDADAESTLALVALAFELQRPDLALRFAAGGLAGNDTNATLHEKRGLALAMLQRPTEACEALRRAAGLDPRSATARLNLAVVEAQQGHLDEARALALEALALQPDYPQARGLLREIDSAR